jgi:hypothetical protein
VAAEIGQPLRGTEGMLRLMLTISITYGIELGAWEDWEAPGKHRRVFSVRAIRNKADRVPSKTYGRPDLSWCAGGRLCR